MKEIINYLRQLQANNNREWFNAHKDEFLKCQDRFNELVEEVIKEISVFDPVMARLTPKDCTYRIYRERNQVIRDIISTSVRVVTIAIRIVTCWLLVTIVANPRC